MKHTSSIRKIGAIFLLVVFSVSTAPKNFFHDVLAHHQDVVGSDHQETSTACVHAQHFHCLCDELVVTLPFVLEKDGFLGEVTFAGVTRKCVYSPGHAQFVFSEKSGRGPPRV